MTAKRTPAKAAPKPAPKPAKPFTIDTSGKGQIQQNPAPASPAPFRGIDTSGNPNGIVNYTPSETHYDTPAAPDLAGTVGQSNTPTGPNGTDRTPVTSPGTTPAQQNAFDILKGQLDQYGLGSLSSFVFNEIVGGKSSDEVARDLRNTPEFANRFPAIALREKAGLPAVSPGEYVAYEKTATEQMRAAGLPPGFYDSPNDFTNLIANNVSPAELSSRINDAKTATYNIPPEVSDRLHQQFGLAPGSGQLAAYFLDPNKALPILQQQIDAAKIGGAADRTGYQGLSNAAAQGLAQQGVTESQAQQGFNQLQTQQSLFTPLPGEQGTPISQGEQLGAAFGGDAAAQRRIEAERAKRQADFSGAAGYASTGNGVTGLGAADQK